MRMKVYIVSFCVTVFVLIPAITKSQPGSIRIGLEGGPGLSTLRYDLFFYPSKYIEAGPGGTAGFSFTYDINKKLSFKTNLLWELKGNTRKTDEDYRLNYITVPLLLQIRFGKTPTGFFTLGPFIGFQLPVPGDVDIYYKPIDFGASLGVGLDVPLSSQFGMTFEIRNNLGLLNISSNHSYIDNHGNPVVEIGDLFTNTVVFQTGLLYRIKQKVK